MSLTYVGKLSGDREKEDKKACKPKGFSLKPRKRFILKCPKEDCSLLIAIRNKGHEKTDATRRGGKMKDLTSQGSLRITFLFMLLAAVTVLAITVSTPGSAYSQSFDKEHLEIMEHISEDLEEIHEDMHKVAFSMKLVSWSAIGILIALFFQSVLMLKGYLDGRKRSQ